MTDHEMKSLPFALPSIGEEEIDEVVDTLRSGWLTTGAKTKRFEEDFNTFIGAQHSLAVNSGTSAMHLALEAIGIARGDKVVTTPFTFTATAEVIRYLGADPVFVDIDPRTFNIDVEKLENTLETTKGIKAILPVHFAGQACEMDEILALAKKFGLKIVEDAAHALPTTYKGQLVGTFGDVTAFSFYVTKTLATGEGGMAVTNDTALFERMKTMRLHGISRDVFDRYQSKTASWYYEVVAPGYKYNLTDIAASIGLHQLKKLEQFQQRRQQIAHRYNEGLKDLPLGIPYVKRPQDTHSCHLYVIQLELDRLSISRDEFIEQMCEAGIGTSVHFIPLHIQPYWRDRYNYNADDFPVAMRTYKHIVSLPIYPAMTDGDVDRVISAVANILRQASK